MAYYFRQRSDGGYIDYGSSSDFFILGDFSITLWVKFDSIGVAADGDPLIQKQNAFFGLAPIEALTKFSATNGYGVFGGDERGSGSVGVSCIPGAVDPAYKLNPGAWMFFGFARDAAGKSYVSYFGSRLALVDGPTFTYTGTPAPIDGGGLLAVGNLTFGEHIGPFSIWRRILTKAEMLLMAQCTPPADPTHDMLLWSRMFEGADDASSYARHPTFHAAPVFEPDNGCASFAAGEDYRLYNA